METAGCPNTITPCSECRCIECTQGRYMTGQCPKCMFCSNGSAMKPVSVSCAVRRVKEEPKEKEHKTE